MIETRHPSWDDGYLTTYFLLKEKIDEKLLEEELRKGKEIEDWRYWYSFILNPPSNPPFKPDKRIEQDCQFYGSFSPEAVREMVCCHKNIEVPQTEIAIKKRGFFCGDVKVLSSLWRDIILQPPVDYKGIEGLLDKNLGRYDWLVEEVQRFFEKLPKLCLKSRELDKEIIYVWSWSW